jgi:hypothetical protein
MTRCFELHGENEIEYDLACTLILVCDFLYMGLKFLGSQVFWMRVK